MLQEFLNQIQRGGFLLVLFVAGMLLVPAVFSQQESASLLTPDQEEFTKTDRLLMPWIGQQCVASILGLEEPDDCLVLNKAQLRSHNRHSLYRKDGSNWYTFHFNNLLEKPYWKFSGIGPENEEFQPFLNFKGRVTTILLRLVAESENWFEVEINEATRETRFVAKTDPNWKDVDWDYYMKRGRWMYIREADYDLYDEPNGKPLEGITKSDSGVVYMVRLEGEWAFVSNYPKETQVPANERVFGWVRWREGREFLIGCIYNNFDGKFGKFKK